MKNHIFFFLAFFLLIPAYSGADDFHGAPVISGGRIKEKTDDRLELKTPLPHGEVLAFYQSALKDLKDIKYRHWKRAVYIEDDGNRQWHSITISTKDESGTTVVIAKDSWTWIFGTLFLRYIGVFVVLMVLFLAMAFSGRVISGIVEGIEKKRQLQGSAPGPQE